MIKGLLKKENEMSALTKELQVGFEYLKNTDFSYVADGKYEIDGDNVYANVQSYMTKDDADFEAHKRYIDIQYVISGEEKIGVLNYEKCQPKVSYDKEKDIEFLSGKGSYVDLKEGEYMVLYPEDAHKPSISIDNKNPERVRKVVVKVHI